MALVGHGQLLAAFGSAAGQHFAAVGGGHPFAESVGAGTFDPAGLIGPLHYSSSSFVGSLNFIVKRLVVSGINIL